MDDEYISAVKFGSDTYVFRASDIVSPKSNDPSEYKDTLPFADNEGGVEWKKLGSVSTGVTKFCDTTGNISMGIGMIMIGKALTCTGLQHYVDYFPTYTDVLNDDELRVAIFTNDHTLTSYQCGWLYMMPDT